MDALRKSVLNLGICQADSFGKDRKIEPEERTKFNIISVFALENGKVDVDPKNIQQLSEKELVRRIPQQPLPLRQTEEWHQSLAETVGELPGLLAPKPQGTTATLNVIYVHNEEDSAKGMSQDTLLKLFDTFGLDRSILHFLRRGADTWHCIRRNDETCAFLLIIQSLYRMACSFSPQGRETNCVVFGKPPKKVEDEVDETDFNFYEPAWFYEQSPSGNKRRDNQSKLDDRKKFDPSCAFKKLLAKIQCHHLHHPLSLAYLGLVDSLSSIFIRVDKEVETIGDLEDKATERIDDDGKTLDSLVSLSEKAGRASVTMARLSKATGVASMLLQTLQDRKGWKRWCRRFFPTNSGSQYDCAAEWLAEGLPSCRQILGNEKLQIQSQDDRLKALTPIVSWRSPQMFLRTVSCTDTIYCKLFALISRADAQSGLTIAVMTMTFLPATSIAAIMAVPWDRGGHRAQAIQAIVYGVVTFVLTVAVFLIWMRGATWVKKVTRGAKWFKGNLTWPRKAAERDTDV